MALNHKGNWILYSSSLKVEEKKWPYFFQVHFIELWTFCNVKNSRIKNKIGEIKYPVT